MGNAFFTVIFIFPTELYRNGEFVPNEEGVDREKDFRPRGVHNYLLKSRVTIGAPVDELGAI